MALSRLAAARPQRVSLRMRLVATLMVLAMAGLVVSGFVINSQLQKYLMQRIDQQLIDGINPVAGRLFGPTSGMSNGPSPGGRMNLPAGTYGALYQVSDGDRESELQLSFTGGNTSAIDPNATSVFSRPDITAAQISAAAAAGGPMLLTVSGSGDISSYRVLLQPDRSGNYVVAIAMPLTEIDATLQQLLWLEIGVGIGALAILGLITYLIVRAELRPLERMSETASEIAAGDLSHRVDEHSGGTEVGQLGAALNVMLTRIEESFAVQQASEDRLRRFIGDASHELRTPLTSIRGYAEMFHRGAGSEPADLATIMRRIEGESERMSGLVDDLLLLARLDQQRPLEREPVELRQLLSDVSLDTAASHPNHTITVHAPFPGWIRGDEAALRQVMMNLARNACVHTPAGTPVELILAGGTPDAAVITVVDHGPGIPDELATEVFERFTRADSSRGRDAGGAGLGLSIVAAIVAAHGGTVGHTVTPGGGATFIVTLPVALGAAHPEPLAFSSATPASPASES